MQDLSPQLAADADRTCEYFITFPAGREHVFMREVFVTSHGEHKIIRHVVPPRPDNPDGRILVKS